MDQDAFRNLLANTPAQQPNPRQGASIVPQKFAASASSEPAFKPRKVKKAGSKYRDRAAERREGTGNDYAQVEAVLEEFEKRIGDEDKDLIEQQRKYLGGDSEHTILVKGLDMSLFEQNRVRAVVSTEDDETLEQAYAEAASTTEPIEQKKRTREEIIRDLKANQQNGDKSSKPAVEKSVEGVSTPFETAKQVGKFRPIGFKPVGQTEKSKKRKVKGGKGAEKKKQKLESTPMQSGTKDKVAQGAPMSLQERDKIEALSLKVPEKPPEPEPVLLDENFDIFAGAGVYEGFPDGEESDEEQRDVETAHTGQGTTVPVPVPTAKGWFDEPELEAQLSPVTPEKSPAISETEEPLRLKPLESSALPSIRDFLAVDEAVEKAEKRKARKEKRKKKKEVGDGD